MSAASDQPRDARGRWSTKQGSDTDPNVLDASAASTLGPLTGAELMACIRALEPHLPDGHHAEIVTVGGGALAMQGLRDTTRDVDCITPLDLHVLAAAEHVARHRSMPSSWLNSNASAFAPSDPRTPIILYRSDKLTIRAAHPDDLFIMKLDSGRPDRDLPDLIKLWPHCSYHGAEAAVADYYERMPTAADDEYLVDFVRHIIEQADGDDA